MEVLLKSAAVLLLTALAALLLRKNAPELALLLSMAAATVVALSACGFLEPFRELIALTRALLEDSELYLQPVLKCLAAALLARFVGDLCRDASQNAAASVMDFAASVCALGFTVPLLLSVVKSLGGLL